MLGTLALIGLPQAGGRRGGDGDAAFLFLFHPVHRRGAVMDFADLVGLAGIIEDALGRRGLAGVDVRHDTEIAIAFERMAACHDLFLGFWWEPWWPPQIFEDLFGVGDGEPPDLLPAECSCYA